jgi:hypothetical protein
MAFTRFHDDPARIQKQMEISSFSGRYFLNTPGQGTDLPFLEDPQIRLQQWGANLQYNPVSIESELRGLYRPLNRDLVKENDYKTHRFERNGILPAMNMHYRTEQPFVEESRATNPAWMYRDVDIQRWEMPFINPQEAIEQPFNWNVQTRILEKDNFTPTRNF